MSNSRTIISNKQRNVSETPGCSSKALHELQKIVYGDEEIEYEIDEWIKSFANYVKFEDFLEKMEIEGDTVFLSNLKSRSERISFDYISSKNKKEVSKGTVELVYGSKYEFSPELHIFSETGDKKYECYFSEDKGLVINPMFYSKKSRSQGISYYRELELNQFNAKLKSGFYVLDIQVDSPNPVRNEYNWYCIYDSTYKLPNEKVLEEYLNKGIDISVNIEKIYEIIWEISLGDVSKYPTISIKVTKKIGKIEEIIGLIELEKGTIKNFTTNSTGSVISLNNIDKTKKIDNLKTWSYSNLCFSASMNDDGKVSFNYRLHDIPKEQLNREITPINEFNKIEKEVEEVKQLAKNLFRIN